jgi:hypothetical protein
MESFNFVDYYKNTSEVVFGECKKIKCPDRNLIVIELRKTNELLKEIKKISPNIDKLFIDYLKENLTIGLGNGLHSPKSFCSDTVLNDQYFISPEILKKTWIDYTTTLCWLKQLEKDGLII